MASVEQGGDEGTPDEEKGNGRQVDEKVGEEEQVEQTGRIEPEGKGSTGRWLDDATVREDDQL